MREYSYHLWCSKKHLLLAKTHLDETAEKLYSECNEVCQVSNATRIESEDALRNLLASEEHISDILSQKQIPELRELNDEIRKLRQDIALTNLPFRANLPVNKDAIQAIETARKRTDDIITKIDKYATEMKQELTDVECGKCAEDLRQDIIIAPVKTNETTEQKTEKIEPAPVSAEQPPKETPHPVNNELNIDDLVEVVEIKPPQNG
jgi:DNA-binding transcriptional regulator YiaG